MKVEICNETAKSVNFYEVEIIELPIVIGDSPSVSTGGPPMSVDWIPIRRTKWSIDYYEEEFGKRRRTKTSGNSKRGLIISGAGRTNFFLRCGYSMSEIEEATQISQRFKREMTISKIFNNNDTPPATTTDRFVTNAERKKKTKKKISPKTGTTLKRSWSDSAASNPRHLFLVPPQRISSPSAPDKMARKKVERNKSLPIDIEKMMATSRRRPPTIPSRKQSPIRGMQQVSTTIDVPACSPTISQPNSCGNLLTRNISMPMERRIESPPVRPTRDISPSSARRQRQVPTISTRSGTTISTTSSINNNKNNNPHHHPVQPQRKELPPCDDILSSRFQLGRNKSSPLLKKNAQHHQLPPTQPSRASSPFYSPRKGRRQTTTGGQLPPIQPKRQGDSRTDSMNTIPKGIKRNQSMPVVPRHHRSTTRGSSSLEDEDATNEAILLTRSPPSRASSPTMAAITDNFSPKSPGLQMPMRKLSPTIPATRKSFSVVSAVGLSLIPSPPPPPSSSSSSSPSTMITAAAAAATTMMLISPPPPSLSSSSSSSSLSASNGITPPVMPRRNRSPIYLCSYYRRLFFNRLELCFCCCDQ